MNKENGIANHLRAVRTRRGMSQQDLANAAGVARQTIGGIEAASYSLSMAVALRLAKALDCTVDDLFWLEDDLTIIHAIIADGADTAISGAETPVSVARVGERWIASPLVGEAAYRRAMIPADGIAALNEDGKTVSVRLFDRQDVLGQTVRLAGCAPALSLWAQSAERWHPGLRIQWTHANSLSALAQLADREVHVAGIHLAGIDANASFLREAMNGDPAVLVNLGVWDEGFLVAPGNPKCLNNAKDLTRPDIVLANRESGAGARRLLDSVLAAAKVDPSSVTGYQRPLPGHFEVAQEICAGRADIGVSTAGVARAHGLSFVALQSVRYDLALRRESMEIDSVQHLLATLHHRSVRKQLGELGGYDTQFTGDIEEVS